MTQAREGLGTTTAALVPSGNVSGQAAGAHQSAETLLGQFLSSRPDYNRYGNSYEADLNAGREIDLFGSLHRGREAVRADDQASEAGVIATRLAVSAQTESAHAAVAAFRALGRGWQPPVFDDEAPKMRLKYAFPRS